jgi:adenylosuccinate lyase
MSNIESILAISAVDGRYRRKVEDLAPIVSEFGLMRFRVEVECAWFLFLCAEPGIVELPQLQEADRDFVRSIATEFDTAAAHQIKQFEATTNHDVKAVEYFVKARLVERSALAPLAEWVHFSCTSEDINNTAYALMVKHARQSVLLPQMDTVIAQLDQLAGEQAELGMLSRTHGQTASPTTLGKELKNVAARLQRQRVQFANGEILAKFNGAVGNFNAESLIP